MASLAESHDFQKKRPHDPHIGGPSYTESNRDGAGVAIVAAVIFIIVMLVIA